MRACAKSLQSCPTLCNPISSPPGFSVHVILQARILEWLPFPSPEDLPNPGIEPKPLKAPAMQVDSLPLSHQGSPKMWCVYIYTYMYMYIYIYIHIPIRYICGIYIYTILYIHAYIHTKWNTTAKKKNKILPFSTLWMDLESFMLSEISQTERHQYQKISLVYAI